MTLLVGLVLQVVRRRPAHEVLELIGRQHREIPANADSFYDVQIGFRD